MAKFYAARGEENKIFNNWDDCKFFLEGKKGYKYKSFSTKAEAEAFLKGEDFYADAVKRDIDGGWCVAYTDGSFEDGANGYSHAVIFLDTDGKRADFCGRGNKREFLSSRNIAGEVEGVLAAVKYAFVRGFAKLKIYHDYEGLAKWANGEWSAKSPISSYYKSELSKYKSAVEFEFVKVKGHSNNAYNEAADVLAKRALFEGYSVGVKGRGFCVTGEDEAKEIAERLNKLVARAKFSFTPFGTRFSFNGEELNVYTGNGVTVVAGDGGYMYYLVASELIRSGGDTERIRVANRAFDLPFGSLSCGDGFSIARAVKDADVANCGYALLFALNELTDGIKNALDTVGVKYEKISSIFKKDGDGFYLTEDVDGREKLEKAYCFLYKYRIGLADRSFDGETVAKLIADAEEINGELNG